MSLRIRRGTEAQRTGVAFDSGELVVTTDEFKLYVGDGITLGGRNIATNLGGSGIVYNEDTGRLDLSLNITADDVPNGVNNQYFSTELAQDAAASLLTLGQHIGIGFSYTVVQDGANRIDATVSLNLDDLGDVVISETPTNGQVLKYNSTAGKWVPAADSGTGGGLMSLQDDLTPTLGGDLTLNSHDITGTGNIDITGNISGLGDINVTGTITSSTGLGSNLDLNSNDITGTGNINIIGTITTPKLTITGNKIVSDGADVLDLVTPTSNGVATRSITTGSFTNYPAFYIRASRGTVDVPTNTVAGDPIGQLVIEGYYSGQFKSLGVFGGRWDPAATLTDTNPKSNIFFSSNGGGSTINYATFDGKGVFNAPIFKATGYATASLPEAPEEGWMVFDSTTKQFKGWNGTTWVVLG